MSTHERGATIGGLKVDGSARYDVAAAAFLGIIAVITLVAAFGPEFYAFVYPDEFEFAWQARQVAMGRLPYADFFSFVPPGALFGGAAVLKLFGASILALRVVTLALLALTTVVAYSVFLGTSGSRAASIGAALWLPMILVSYWPIASHHWFAAAPGVLAVAMAVRAGRSERPGWAFGAGMAAALSAAMIQPDGVVYAAVAAGALLVTCQRDLGAKLARFGAGVDATALMVLIVLAAFGILGDTLYSTVVWPFLSYRQPGGFNDLSTLDFVRTMMQATNVQPVNGMANAVGHVIVALTVLSFAVIDGARATLRRDWKRLRGRRAVGIGLALSAIAFVLVVGRTDWNHFVFVFPAILVSGFLAARHRPERVKLLTVVVLLPVLLSAVGWVAYLTSPTATWRIAHVDDDMRAWGEAAILAVHPEIVEDSSAIVHLTPRGAQLYFYWAPAAPPVSWVAPPRSRYSSAAHYDDMAQFIEAERVPYLVVDQLDAFLSASGTALSTLLSERYVPCSTWRGADLVAARDIGCPGQEAF